MRCLINSRRCEIGLSHNVGGGPSSFSRPLSEVTPSLFIQQPNLGGVSARPECSLGAKGFGCRILGTRKVTPTKGFAKDTTHEESVATAGLHHRMRGIFFYLLHFFCLPSPVFSLSRLRDEEALRVLSEVHCSLSEMISAPRSLFLLKVCKPCLFSAAIQCYKRT